MRDRLIRSLHSALLAAAACACALPVGIAHAGQALVRIELAPGTRVARPEVTLGEIASLSSENLDVLKRLMALPLGPAPRVGEPARLSRADLMRWIRARTGIEAGQVAWEGSETTQLYRASGDIPASQLVATAGDALRAWLGERSARALITPDASVRDVAAPFGQSMLKVRPIPAQAPLARRMLVWVDLWVEGNFVRSIPVGFEVQAFGPAYVAAQDLPAGSRVEAPALAVREIDLAGRAAPLQSAPEGQQLRNALPAGQVLTAKDVQPQAAVTRGDWVALRLRSGGIELESRVEALQGGRVGQLVSVKPGNASAPILARVVGPGQVEVTQ